MSRHTIETMIPKALEVAQNFTENSTNQIQSKYFSAVANFGVSVLSSGIKVTVLFYKDKFKDKDISKFITEIVKVVDSDIKDLYNYDKKHYVLDASTALKLAMRSFEKIDNKSDEDK